MVGNRNNQIEKLGFGMPWEDSHGYSQAIRIGDTVRISGQMPHDEFGNVVGLNNPAAQAEAVFANLDRVLSAFGLNRQHVVENHIYIVDIAKHFGLVSEAHKRFFGDHRPVSSAFGVAGLVLPGQLVEITATASLSLR